jgi:hypothetical protein
MLDEQLQARTQTIKAMSETLKTKETIANVNSFKKRFDAFSAIENINELNKVYLPKIRHLHDHMDETTASNVEMRECIAQFDRDLTLKCNKSSV